MSDSLTSVVTTNPRLLEVENLSVVFPSRFGEFTALDNFNLSLEAGQIHGLVGESGAGKSTVGAAIIGLIPSPGYISHGEITLSGKTLTAIDDDEYHRLRGKRISMIFQDPQTSLNPLLTISDQLIETIVQHAPMSASDARTKAINLLTETGIQNAAGRIDDYPHEFSGGMRQRVVIALALCTDPELIIADEPTTALDVAVQKQILNLIRTLADARGVGFILITHDIGVIAEVCDSVTVLRNGKVMESGDTVNVIATPSHPYTQALMAAVPRLDVRLDRFTNIVEDDLSIDATPWVIEGASASLATEWLMEQESTSQAKPDHPVLSIRHLDVVFGGGKRRWFVKQAGFKALSDLSLDVHKGEVLGVVGESGSGKSTLAKAIVGLVQPTAGTMHFQGEPLPYARKRSRHHDSRRKIQMIFQDPYSSLNNRRTIEKILAEPIRFFAQDQSTSDTRRLIASILELVEMPQSAMLKFPHQFSGGQRQRIAVARALLARPEFLICDEPTSALDVSIQAQVLNLLKDLQSSLGLSILFISHNLAVVRQMADRVVVLKQGELVETGIADEFFTQPTAEYSQLLLRETPSLAMLPSA